MASQSSSVTVVVATRDRREQAMETVDRLRALPERPPIVLVDDGSTDGTADAVQESFPDVTVVRLGRGRGVAAARNLGVTAASTPYVAFSDDDSWWAAGALSILEGAFSRHPTLALICGRILVGEEERLDATCVSMRDSPLPSDGLPGPRILGFVACGAAVRRAAFIDAGGFPEPYGIGGEEYPLALSMAGAGWDLAYVEEATAYHRPEDAGRSPDGRVRNMTRNDLWTAWSQRRPGGALRSTLAIITRANTPAEWEGIAQAGKRLPAVLMRRRPVPPHIEGQLRTLEDGSAGSKKHRGPRIAVHHPPSPSTVRNERLAAVVITHNRVAELLESVGRLDTLPERPHIVVVDNGSTDGTSTAVRSHYPEVELITLDGNAGAVGRNVAVARLDQPYVAFADDDTWWEPGSLAAAVVVLDRNPQVAVVTARIVMEPSGLEDPIVADMQSSPLSERPDLPGHPLVSFLAGASVIRREAFEQVGGFEPKLWLGGEEELLSADLLAAGWHLRYVPHLTVHHAASPLRDAHRRRRDGLRNTLWCAWLRRPLHRALRRSWAVLRRAPRDAVTASAVVEALRGLGWVIRNRRRLPAHVERQLRLLDVAQLDSPARRYVS